VSPSSMDPGADGSVGRVADGKSMGEGALGAGAAFFGVAVSAGTCRSRLMTRSGRARTSSSDGRRDSIAVRAAAVGTAGFAAGVAIIVLPRASALGGFTVCADALLAVAIACAAGVTAVDASVVIVVGLRGCAAGVTAVDGSAIGARGGAGSGDGGARNAPRSGGGRSVAAGGGGDENCAGSPKSVLVTPGDGTIGLPLLGQTRRLGSCSCPQWLHALTTLPVTSLAPI